MNKDNKLIFEAYKEKSKKPIADITYFRECLMKNCPRAARGSVATGPLTSTSFNVENYWTARSYFSDTAKPKTKEAYKRIKVWMTSFRNEVERVNVERECKLFFGARFIKLEDGDIRLYLRVNIPAYNNPEEQQDANQIISLLDI